MPTARSDLGVTGVDGILYAIGGWGGGSGVLDTVESYNTATGQWAALTSMPTARAGLAVTGVDGILYAIGGSGGSNLDTAEAYNI